MLFFTFSRCIAPHSLNSFKIPSNVSAYSDNSYSTTTGVPVNTFLFTKPFISNSFNSVERTFAEMPSTSLLRSLNLLLPSVSATIILNFHLPPITYKASATEFNVALHCAWEGSSLLTFSLDIRDILQLLKGNWLPIVYWLLFVTKGS